MSFLNILKKSIELRNQLWMDPEKIESMQEEKLQSMLECAKKTEHYSEILGDHSPDDFASLPITRKSAIQENPKAFLNPDEKAYSSVRTSGSTGEPLEIFIDREEADYRGAIRHVSDTDMGFSARDRFAEYTFRDYGSNSLMQRLGIYSRKVFSVFNSDEENYAHLKSYKATFAGRYPSVMTALARMNLENPIKLKTVITGGEPLTGKARQFIADSFSCNVLDHYGVEEFSTVAWECPEEHSLHVNPSLHLEITGSDGRPASSGNIIITPLKNRAMPILRYFSGDLGGWGRECGCGRGTKVLASLKGRKDSLIVLPSGRVRSALTINLMDDLTYLRIFQIIQEKEDLFVFRYVPLENDLDKNQIGEISGRIRRACMGEDVRIEFERVPEIRKGKSGKISTAISKVARRNSPDYLLWNSE